MVLVIISLISCVIWFNYLQEFLFLQTLVLIGKLNSRRGESTDKILQGEGNKGVLLHVEDESMSFTVKRKIIFGRVLCVAQNRPCQVAPLFVVCIHRSRTLN
jgi:hypothetical protein